MDPVDSQFWQYRGRPVRPVCPVIIRVGFVLFWKFLYKPTRRGVRLPRPINIKAKADWGNPNRFTHLSFTFYLQTLNFPISSVVLRSSLWHSRMFWVACRPQSNPRSTRSDGVPPELEILGFRRLPGAPVWPVCITGLTGLHRETVSVDHFLWSCCAF